MYVYLPEVRYTQSIGYEYTGQAICEREILHNHVLYRNRKKDSSPAFYTEENKNIVIKTRKWQKKFLGPPKCFVYHTKPQKGLNLFKASQKGAPVGIKSSEHSYLSEVYMCNDNYELFNYKFDHGPNCKQLGPIFQDAYFLSDISFMRRYFLGPI